MDSKTIIASIVGAIVLFILGMLTYGMLASNFMTTQLLTPAAHKEMPDFLMLGLGHLPLGILLALIFNRWANISTAVTGAKAGAVIGILIELGYGLINQGTMNTMTVTGMLGSTVIAAINMAIAGAVVGWYLGRGK